MPGHEGENPAALGQREKPFAGGKPIVVGHQAALGAAGGAGGVENRRLGGAAERPRDSPFGCRRQALRRRVDLDDRRRPLQLGRDSLQTRDVMAQRHHENGSAMAQLVLQFCMPMIRIYRHDAGPDRVERQKVHEKFRPVFQQQGHAMSESVSGPVIASG